MIYKSTQYTEKPQAVKVEPLHDGTANVWLTQKAKEVTLPGPGEDQPAQTVYEADTAFFVADEAPTPEAITADFEGWWLYAENWTPEENEPTLEQRVQNVEAALLAIMEL